MQQRGLQRLKYLLVTIWLFTETFVDAGTSPWHPMAPMLSIDSHHVWDPHSLWTRPLPKVHLTMKTSTYSFCAGRCRCGGGRAGGRRVDFKSLAAPLSLCKPQARCLADQAVTHFLTSLVVKRGWEVLALDWRGVKEGNLTETQSAGRQLWTLLRRKNHCESQHTCPSKPVSSWPKCVRQWAQAQGHVFSPLTLDAYAPDPGG